MRVDCSPAPTRSPASGVTPPWAAKAPTRCLGHHVIAGCGVAWKAGFPAPPLPPTIAGRPAKASILPEIIARAATDPACRASLDRYTDRLARGLATIVSILDPGVIVLGGGMSNVASLYHELPQRVEHWAFTDRLATPIRRAVHGDSSGVRGAAWLGREAARAAA